nr:Glu/Leu/Phe/Val dehydrogenase family protein [Alicyclobacillus sacchari]
MYGTDDLVGRRVAIQGLGSVGCELARLLRVDGANLLVADVTPLQVERAVNEFGAQPLSPQDTLSAECDILAPCALGAVLNDETIPRLRAQIVAGSANNLLAQERHGGMLHERGILYAPDYVINAGGLINVADELEGYHPDRARSKVERGIPTHRAADEMAMKRIETLRQVRSTHLGHHEPVRRGR